MDYQKVIETLQDIHDVAEIRVKNGDARGAIYIPNDKLDDVKMAISAMKELQEYKKIGTLEEVREAVDKQKPIAPTYEGDGYAPDGTFVWDEWICPNCGTRYEVEFEQHDYCHECGQAIDWSE